MKNKTSLQSDQFQHTVFPVFVDQSNPKLDNPQQATKKIYGKLDESMNFERLMYLELEEAKEPIEMQIDQLHQAIYLELNAK